jgi:hypothetical protein
MLRKGQQQGYTLAFPSTAQKTFIFFKLLVI